MFESNTSPPPAFPLPAEADASGQRLCDVLLELQHCIEPALAALRANKGQLAFAAVADASAAVAPLIQDEHIRPCADASLATASLVLANAPTLVPEGAVLPASVDVSGARFATTKVKFEVGGPDEFQPKDHPQQKDF